MNGKRILKKPARAGTLNTYFTSLLSVILSGTMLLGTTWAWLTGDTSSAGNRIQTGSFAVQLAHVTGGHSVAVLGGEGSHPVFSNARWTPGRTEVQTVRVSNTGTLEAYCRLGFSSGQATTAARMSTASVAALFTVYSKPGVVGTGEVPSPANGWSELGTLSELMDNQQKLLLDGLFLPRQQDTISIALQLTGDTAAVSTVMGRSFQVCLELDAVQPLDNDTIN